MATYLPSQMDLAQVQAALGRLESDYQKGTVDEQTYFDLRMKLETMLAVLDGGDMKQKGKQVG